MKKLMLSICLLVVVMGMVGCGSTKKEEKEDTKQYVEVAGEKFTLDSNADFYDLHFKENYVDLQTNRMGKIYSLGLQKAGDVLFEIRLLYEDTHTLEENKAQFQGTEQQKTVNGITYSYYDYLVDTGANAHAYLREYKGATYVILFISTNDISDLETTFMNNVTFE